jgi:hypothetical protein
MATVREFIDALAAAAAELRDGLETEVELAVADGENMQMVGEVDIDYWAEVPADGSGGGRQFVLIRGHLRPGEDGKAPRRLRAVTADADEHLRRWSSE